MCPSDRENTEHQALRSAVIFSGLSDQDFQLLLGALRRTVVPEGETIFQQDAMGDSLIALADGCLSVRYERSSGDNVKVDRVQPGEIVGEMSCFDPAPRAATIEAIEDSVVYELQRVVLHSLYDNAPRVATHIVRAVIALVHQRLLTLENRIAGKLGANSPKHRPSSGPRGAGTVVSGRLDPDTITLPKGLESADLAVLAGAGIRKRYQSGDELCVEGERGSNCFFVLRGELELLREGRRLAVLAGGTIAGQIALVADSPRSATLRALGEVDTLELSRSDFEGLLLAASPLALRFQRQIAATAIRQHRGVLRRLESVIDLPDSSRSADVDNDDTESGPGATKTSGEQDGLREQLADYMAGLTEWGISVEDLQDIEVADTAGQLSAAEVRARKRFK